MPPPPVSNAVPFNRHRLQALIDTESAQYRQAHPRSLALAHDGQAHWLFGLPMHWMRDWPMPAVPSVARAQDHRLVTADGHELLDFCLGDTGAMYGHSPRPVAEALARQATQGLTTMLPGPSVPAIGQRLAGLFGLPRWQLALSATDANRFALRWARAVTGRPKVLVFEGCYHGTVDDTLVDRGEGGRTLPRASLLGQVADPSVGTVVVPFNDAAAVVEALARGDVAAVLTEPALTNCGLVPPIPGFLDQVQQACREAGTLFVLDETHTMSTAWGGYARAHGLQPDMLVAGKAIAGGVPCAVYGFTEALATRMEAAKREAPAGHSGIGTTLTASGLVQAALLASLSEVITRDAHARMDVMAARLERGLASLLAARGLPWCVTRLGARLELQFRPTPPRDAVEARAAMDERLEQALSLYLLNRGVLITPFHLMWLVAPSVRDADVDRAVGLVGAFLDALA